MGPVHCHPEKLGPRALPSSRLTGTAIFRGGAAPLALKIGLRKIARKSQKIENQLLLFSGEIFSVLVGNHSFLQDHKDNKQGPPSPRAAAGLAVLMLE